MAMTSRRIGREFALRVLYAYEMSRAPIEELIADRMMGELKSEKIRKFSHALVRLSAEHMEEFDQMIRAKVKNWEFHRIAVIDRLVLRIGICELKYFSDIPPRVTINEAIEIAKRFSTEKSGKFINGVLDAILQDLKRTGQLIKTGTGLLEG